MIYYRSCRTNGSSVLFHKETLREMYKMPKIFKSQICLIKFAKSSRKKPSIRIKLKET